MANAEYAVLFRVYEIGRLRDHGAASTAVQATRQTHRRGAVHHTATKGIRRASVETPMTVVGPRGKVGSYAIVMIPNCKTRSSALNDVLHGLEDSG